MGNNTF